jgi:hypothetical protein
MNGKTQLEALFQQRYGIKTIIEEDSSNNNRITITYQNNRVRIEQRFSTNMQIKFVFDDLLLGIRRDVKGTKGDPIFSDLAEAVYDIEADLHHLGKHMVVDYTDRHSKKTEQEYFQYVQKTNKWDKADASLKAINEVLKADSVDTTITVVEHGYYNVPKVDFAKDILTIPQSNINSSNTNQRDVYIRTVKYLEQSSDKVVFSVEEIRLASGDSDVKYRNSIFTAIKVEGAPISLKRTDIKDKDWWGYKIISPLDFERHPLNTDIWEHIVGADPKFVTDTVYITATERIWMNTKSGWVLVDLDYVKTYGKNILSESVVLEVSAYLNIKSIIN